MNKSIIIASIIIGIFIVIAVIVNNSMEQDRLIKKQQRIAFCRNEVVKEVRATAADRENYCSFLMKGQPYTDEMCSELISQKVDRGLKKCKSVMILTIFNPCICLQVEGSP